MHKKARQNNTFVWQNTHIQIPHLYNIATLFNRLDLFSNKDNCGQYDLQTLEMVPQLQKQSTIVSYAQEFASYVRMQDATICINKCHSLYSIYSNPISVFVMHDNTGTVQTFSVPDRIFFIVRYKKSVFMLSNSKSKLVNIHLLNKMETTYEVPHPLTIKGEKPTARYYVACDTIGHELVMFGGSGSIIFHNTSCLYNEVWAFDMIKRTWRCVPTSGKKPPEMMFAQFFAFKGLLYMLPGITEGKTSLQCSNLYVLDWASKIWSQFEMRGDTFLQCSQKSSMLCVHDFKVYAVDALTRELMYFELSRDRFWNDNMKPVPMAYRDVRVLFK